MEFNENEADIYRFICDYIQKFTHPPTVREISQNCYMSHANVIRYLDRLELHGYIVREYRRARGITLTNKKPRL